MNSQESDTARPNQLSSSFDEESLLALLNFSHEHSSELVFWLNANLEIIHANATACKQLNYDLSELSRRPIGQLAPALSEDKRTRSWHKSEIGNTLELETFLVPQSGARIPVKIRAHLLESHAGNYVIVYASEHPLQDEAPPEKSKLSQSSDNTNESSELNALRIKLANDSAGIGVWDWDVTSGELIWDEWMYQLYGITEDRFSGAFEAWENSVHPDDIEFAKSELENALAGTGVYEPEFRVVWPDGQVRTLKASAEVLRDQSGQPIKVIGVNYDITDHVQALKELGESRDQSNLLALRMKLANDSAGIGVWEWDVTSGELIWDEWMYQLYGITEDRFSGAFEAWENSVHPDDIEFAKSELENALAGTGVYEPEFRVVWPDGQVRTMKASAEVIRNPQGQAIKVIGVNYDVTELESAKNQALNSAKAKSQFLANMSHEIRTPMNGVFGLTNILLNSELTAEQRKWAEGIKASTTSLLTIINDILDISKMESGKLELESVPFIMAQMLDEVAQPLCILAENQSISLITEADNGSRNMQCIGDPIRIKQVITNLVNNAIKFTEKGSVRLQVKLLPSNDEDIARVQFKIIDTGIGIPETRIDDLFERFSQADASTTRRFGGTGLGLSISKQLVDLMGGEIGCDSIEGEGSTFWFTLNLKLAESGQNETNVARLKRFEDTKFQGLKVLLVEDVEINQVVASTIFKGMGMEVDIACNGIEALHLIKSAHYDVIFMDCHMPQMDGFEATRQIRALPSGVGLPVIALTAGAMKEEHDKCIASGMNLVVTKPFEVVDIVTAIQQVMPQ